MPTTFCPVYTSKGQAPPCLLRTCDVHTPCPECLRPQPCQAIERSQLFRLCVGFKPPAVEHLVKELDPCHTRQMVVAGACLAYGGVALALAPGLGTPARCRRCERSQRL
jgi:hypothetical protein